MTGRQNAQLVTGVCCQWRDSASYDSVVVNETFVLRGEFIGEIATEQQPPIRYRQVYKDRRQLEKK